MKAIPGNEALRCRKCEGQLSKPKIVNQEKYPIVPTRFGAIVRNCMECEQLWLAWMQETPKGGQKIVMKMIDKEL
jgi:hypothetical protein